MEIPAALQSEVLPEYKLELTAGEKLKEYWLLKGVNNSYALWEYQGNLDILHQNLEWRQGLREKGFHGFPRLIETKRERSFIKLDDKAYYLTRWPEGQYEYFDPQKKSSCLQVIATLAKLHEQSNKATIKKTTQVTLKEQLGLQQDVQPTEDLEVRWLQAFQERLRELVVYNSYLQEKRLVNDFERLYVENSEDYYQRGQEAIQRMVLAHCSTEESCPAGFLVGNFTAENILETAKGIMFLNTTYVPIGLQVYDLSLFLKMYLPLKKWDKDFLREMLTCYGETITLHHKEKQLLLALLLFPSRFCLYAQQYFSDALDPEVLVTKVKNLFSESYWQERCVEDLEKWL